MHAELGVSELPGPLPARVLARGRGRQLPLPADGELRDRGQLQVLGPGRQPPRRRDHPQQPVIRQALHIGGGVFGQRGQQRTRRHRLGHLLLGERLPAQPVRPGHRRQHRRIHISSLPEREHHRRSTQLLFRRDRLAAGIDVVQEPGQVRVRVVVIRAVGRRAQDSQRRAHGGRAGGGRRNRVGVTPVVGRVGVSAVIGRVACYIRCRVRPCPRRSARGRRAAAARHRRDRGRGTGQATRTDLRSGGFFEERSSANSISGESPPSYPRRHPFSRSFKRQSGCGGGAEASGAEVGPRRPAVEVGGRGVRLWRLGAEASGCGGWGPRRPAVEVGGRGVRLWRLGAEASAVEEGRKKKKRKGVRPRPSAARPGKGLEPPLGGGVGERPPPGGRVRPPPGAGYPAERERVQGVGCCPG